MEKVKQLYEKTKQCLQMANNRKPSEAVQILKKVMKEIKILQEMNPQLQKQILQLKVICHNNLACAYNKKRNFRASLYNLKQVCSIENQFLQKSPEKKLQPQIIHQIATTHSNICTVYSQMNQHKKALSQIEKAILKMKKNPDYKKSQAMIVFFYNCAIQLQFLGHYEDGCKVVEKALSFGSCEANNKELRPLLEECLSRMRQKMKLKQKKLGEQIEKSIRGYIGRQKIIQPNNTIRLKKFEMFNKKQNLTLQKIPKKLSNKHDDYGVTKQHLFSTLKTITKRRQSQNNFLIQNNNFKEYLMHDEPQKMRKTAKKGFSYYHDRINDKYRTMENFSYKNL